MNEWIRRHLVVIIAVDVVVTVAVLLLVFRTSLWGGSGDFVRLTNTGKAYLENRQAAGALEAFRAAVRVNPESAPALRNLVRALLLVNEPDEALERLEAARALETESAATAYLTGLVMTRMDRYEEAVQHFSEAVRLDPHSVALRFQLASAAKTIERHDLAEREFRATLERDPLHFSAMFNLAAYARKAGDRAEFVRLMGVYQNTKEALFGKDQAPMEIFERCQYTEAETVAVETDEAPVAPAISVDFVGDTPIVFPDGADRAATVGAALIDAGKNGAYTLIGVSQDGGVFLLRGFGGEHPERTPLAVTVPAGLSPVQVLVGDYHDDVPDGAKYDPAIHALGDVLLASSETLILLKQTARGVFEDVTVAAGLPKLSANRAVWADYEHDGDLDLVLARSSGLELWQNNGDGTFSNVTDAAGIPSMGAATDVVAVDLDADVAIDIVVARGDQPTMVLENQRLGQFKPMPDPPGPWPAARQVLADDLNNDGHMDVVLVGEAAVTILYGRLPRRDRIELMGAGDVAGASVVAGDWRAVLLDYDNDGWLDVLAMGGVADAADAVSLRLRRNRGGDGKSQSAGWDDVSASVGLDRIASLRTVRNILPGDFDADGDSDLLVVTGSGGLRFVRNDGGNANGQLKVRLSSVKTNPSGLGTGFEIRDGRTLIARRFSLPMTEIGLGGVTHADSVRSSWTNGVVDNEIDVTLGTAPMTIKEKEVAIGSCPFLYAWDGDGFRFVTDILGNAPVGLSLTREQVLSADPDEIVRIGDGDSFRPREGRYIVEISEEFREVLYLDHVRLMAVDHAADIEVHPTDKLMPEPFPASQVWHLAPATDLVSAVGDDGVDRTEAVRDVDGVFAPPGALLPPPFRGMCRPLTVTLSFDEIDVTEPLVLALTGWLHYGDASTNIALSQSSAVAVIPPTLEVETESGVWQDVDVVVGMPAGKTKTILCDLGGKLPVGSRRLRLSTTFELRWDRIALLSRVESPPEREHALPPDSAVLRWRGFSVLESRAPGHPTTPDYDAVTDDPPWRTNLAGWCTRYGDVVELVARQDERFVVMNAGDAVTLGFDANELPELSPGLSRTFFFYSFGYEKDGDHNVVDGDTVAPLPVTVRRTSFDEPLDANDWRVRYNSRYVPRHERDTKTAQERHADGR